MVRTLAKSGPRIWAVLRGAPTGFLAFAEEFLVDRVRGESKMFRILVVDDDPSTAFVLREGMNDLRHRYEVDLVPDGVEALNYLYRRGLYVDAQAPDLVLLDINMPRSDGFGTLSAIKTDPELCVIPVIMLSTSGSPRRPKELPSSRKDCPVGCHLLRGFPTHRRYCGCIADGSVSGPEPRRSIGSVRRDCAGKVRNGRGVCRGGVHGRAADGRRTLDIESPVRSRSKRTMLSSPDLTTIQTTV